MSKMGGPAFEHEVTLTVGLCVAFGVALLATVLLNQNQYINSML